MAGYSKKTISKVVVNNTINAVNATNAINATNAVNATQAVSASYALTASYAMNGGGGGGGTPGGSTTQIQYNNDGVFSGVPTLIYSNSLLKVTGSFTGSFIGTFTGTSSWATNVISASYAATASLAPNYVLNSATSSFVINSQTSSFVTNSQTSSFIQNSQTSSMTVATASYVTGSIFTSTNPALSASFALTASYVNESTTITNNTDNYVITATGTSALNGESTLTYNGTTLGVGVTTSLSTTKAHIKGILGIENGSTAGTLADQLLFGYNGSGLSQYNHKIQTSHDSQSVLNKMDFLVSNGASTFLNTLTLRSSGLSRFDSGQGLGVSGSLQVTGSINVTAGITGSLSGTGSWATNALTASYVVTAQTASLATNVIQNAPVQLNLYSALGSTTSVTKAEPVFAQGGILGGSGITMANQSLLGVAVQVPQQTTITGIKWYRTNTPGVYTSTNYNGVGLYSYSGGTLTLVASSSNDGTIWSSSYAGNNTFVTKSFQTSYNASPGIYFAVALYCSSAQTTAPIIGSGPSAIFNINVTAYDYPNSAKHFIATAATVTTLASSVAISTYAASLTQTYLALY